MPTLTPAQEQEAQETLQSERTTLMGLPRTKLMKAAKEAGIQNPKEKEQVKPRLSVILIICLSII